MRSLRTMLLATYAVLSTSAGSGLARAQHVDVLVLGQDGLLVTGQADLESPGGAYSVGQHVYSREFDSEYLINNPGFFALAGDSPSLPPGTEGLPVNTALGWDFLPMQIDDLTANLFYWDGLAANSTPGTVPDDVAFGPLPASGTPDDHYSFTLFDKNNVAYTVDGADEQVDGGLIANTSSSGSLHQHNYFFLDEGSGYLGTPPADGIYLVAMQLHMTGLENSLPLFLAFGTPGSTFEALNNAAVPWIQERVDTLVPVGLPGDYNDDGTIDAADYVAWRYAMAVPGSSLLNDPTPATVEDEDYFYWRNHFGLSLAPGGGSGLLGGAVEMPSVPEPGPAAIMLAAVVILASYRVHLRQ